MPQIKNPVIIIGCPRSGTSLLFRILSSSNELWSLYRESNDIWKKFYKKAKKEFKNEILTESDLNEENKVFLLNEFHKNSLNIYPIGYLIREHILKKESLNNFLPLITNFNFFYKSLFLKEYRLVEKTPKNCFRIPFINKLFHDCKFIYLTRDGKTNINSLIEGWKAKNKYINDLAPDIKLNLKGYEGKHWKFVMPPDWENYVDKPLEEVCAFQWISSNKAALEGLNKIENKRKFFTTYEELISNPYETTDKICNFIEIPFSNKLKNISKNLPRVNTVSKPDNEKWKKNYEQIKNTFPVIEDMMRELGYSASGFEQCVK